MNKTPNLASQTVTTRRKKMEKGAIATLICVLPSLLVLGILTGLVTSAAAPEIVFTSRGADDFDAVGGSIGASGTVFAATAVKLGTGSNIYIDKMVGVESTVAGRAQEVYTKVLSEDFGTGVGEIKIYLNNGVENSLRVTVRSDGTVAENTDPVVIYCGMRAYLKMVGMYDDGTEEGTTNHFALGIY